MRESMACRGPDGSGVWVSADGMTGLAHRRLSIIDLSDAAAQPFSTTDGSLRIVFNGEIYNYRTLRAGLEAKNCRFVSNSDTEVLLYMYQYYGAGMLSRIRGMYAFVIWDDQNKTAFAARDAFGVKPLYYADNGSTLQIASQVKALLHGKNVDTTPEPAGHAGFFLWGWVPEPFTLYRGIRSLPAGSYLTADRHGVKIAKHTSISDMIVSAQHRSLSQGPVTEQAHSEPGLSGFNSALRDSVKHHLISDVPVGVFLSAGIDSASLAALVSEQSRPLHTVTLGFKEFIGSEGDETTLAEKVSKQYGTIHETRWIGRGDFEDSFDHFLSSMDQPSIDGINSYFVSKVASECGIKVAISGLGGDELLGGYPSFSQIPASVRALRPIRSVPMLGGLFRKLSGPIASIFSSPKYAGLLEYGGSFGSAYLLRRSLFMPWELPKVMDRDMAAQGLCSLNSVSLLEQTECRIVNEHLKISALELQWYMKDQLLRDTDWASMAHSLEVRVPLVDEHFFSGILPELLSSAPPRKKELALAPVSPLPEELVNRPKTGFATPIRSWIESSFGISGRGNRSWAKVLHDNFTRKT